MGIAGRAGRWSAAHWKTATLGWLALVATAVAAGGLVGTRHLTAAEQDTGGTARAETILERAGFEPPAGEVVLVRSRQGAAAATPGFRAAVAQLARTLHRLPEVTRVRSGTVSRDGRAQLVTFDLRGNPDSADRRVQPVLDAVAAVGRAQPGFAFQEVGSASAEKAANAVIESDLKRAELFSVPITFAILLVAFGAVVAAGIPVLLAFSAVLAALGLGGPVSHLVHASETTASVVVLMGMAVGVDYSLFYLRREREERARGRGAREALHVAAASSGRAVLLSGLTVVVACAGMTLSGSGDFVSLGTGAILVVLVALVGSLTVLPALLGRLGDRVEWGSLRRSRRTGESRVWRAILRPALRFPKTAAAAGTLALLVVALPALRLHTANPGIDSFPRDLPIVQSYHAVERFFPGSPSPAEVVVRVRDVQAPGIRAAIARMERLALAAGIAAEPFRTSVAADRGVARVELPLVGNGEDARSMAALRTLRSEVIPAAFGGVAGAEVAVGGDTASSYDFSRTMTGRTPFVVGFVLLVAFLLLLVTFRSVVVPLTAIALDLLSVGAAYGVLVWVFQEGHLQGLLGFHPTGAVVTWMPLFLFTVLFGLSMDYHVFVVSRIRELVRRGRPTREAVAEGIGTTASTVTAAALVMVAVFAIFAATRTIIMKELGVGLAVAVLLDATLIRGVLLPAAMTVLGERNWYLPRRLGWLPRLELEGRRAPAVGLD